MTRVLVTGAGGFIGSQVLPVLVERGFEVHAVTSRTPPSASDARWHRYDLLDSGSATRVIADVRPSHLLHLAWYAVPGKFWTAPENLRWVQTTLELLLAFHGHGGQRAVMAGTCAEYDWTSGRCQEHVTPLNPATVYGLCKHATQQALEACTRATGLSGAWGRVFHLYGPRERPERLVPYVIRSLLTNAPAQCSDGKQVRDFMHVEDAARAFVAVLESGHQGPINIASGRPLTVKELVTATAEEIGRRDLLQLGALPTPRNEPQSIVGNIGLLSQLGWSPRYSLIDGIRQTITWWRNNLGNA